jgi:UDP-N-acetylmuramoyl-tripeptide--D-alanyl-D-alanine ligase
MTEIPVNLILSTLGGLLVLWFILERGLALMMFFQQEEYDSPRFFNWLKDKKGYDRAASYWMIAAALVGITSQILLLRDSPLALSFLGYLIWPLMIGGVARGIYKSRLVRRDSKKPLVITSRATRILTVYMGLAILLAAVLLSASLLAPRGDHYAFNLEVESDSWWDIIAFVRVSYNLQVVVGAVFFAVMAQLLPSLLVIANKLLEPYEERVKAGFRNEAIEKFAKLRPKTIAITGSFGKTSTKHILSHVLGAAAPTLATPGSVNTDMGITRVIRESLDDSHQYFIVEMGAYGPGSIARLCKLTPPDVGMITALGAAHYERFKTLETVAAAKFELAESVFLRSGKTVVNKDAMDAALLEDRMKNVVGDYKLVGEGADFAIADTKQTKEGLELTVNDDGEIHQIKAPLYGEHQAGNILLAAACARVVGLPWAAIKGALASVPQIRHRLEVTRISGQPTIINDAYNSNPVGFAGALKCLDVLVELGGRRILITPGMVELGSKHDSEHKRLGALAANHCDIVLVVTPERIPTFMDGLEEANDGSVTVMTFDLQEKAEEWAKRNWEAGDAVLFENNLPDLYEAEFTF